MRFVLVAALLCSVACKKKDVVPQECVDAGNPAELCTCIAGKVDADTLASGFSPSSPAFERVAAAAAECSASTGAVANVLAKTCLQVGWDKATCDCLRDGVNGFDKAKLVARARDRQVASFVQVAQAEAAGLEGKCALSGGTLASDIEVSCGDEKLLCDCVKERLAPGKVKPPESLDGLSAVVVAARDACSVQAPEVRAGVIASCISDGGKAKACECAATTFLDKTDPSAIVEMKRNGWTTDGLGKLREARAACMKHR